jgi:ATP/maltotriose-dependent transcriptional regulator MalT/DNA-binding SARP family transcriptional activator
VTLRRTRLEKQLDEAFGRRLTVVVAGAGFGKSTLLACWCSDVATSWYTLTESDANLDTLARGIGAALDPWLPVPLPATTSSRGTTVERDRERADAYTATLCEGLAVNLAHDLVLVLEDIHEVDAGTGAARLLESMSKQAPALVHIVASSRERAPFPIERLRGRGELLELSGRDLSFTADEISALGAAMAVALDESSALRVLEKTGGWPVAVRLVLEAMRQASPDRDLERVLARIARPEGELYEYFAEEVFAHDDTDLRRVLEVSMPFERVSRTLCSALGADPVLLPELVRRGLAVEHADGWFTLHALVREFVERSWPVSASEAAEIGMRAARWFEDHGNYEEALRSVAAAGSSAELARLISRRGSELLAQGSAATLVRCCESADASIFDRHAEEVLGEAYTLLGDSDRALEHLQRAADTAAGDALPASVAWRMVAAHHLQDDLDSAAMLRKRAHTDDASPLDLALLYAWSAAVERRRGDFAETSQLAEMALHEAERSGDDRALALAHTAAALAGDGTDRDPMPHLRRALAAAERVGDVFQRARIHNNKGSILLESGDYLSAIEELNAAVELAELGSHATLEALATMNRGLCRFCLGRLDEAAADYEAAAALYRETGSGELAYALVGLGDVHRERGDLARARVRYEEGLTLGEESGDRQALVPALYQLAKVIVDDQPERALLLTERAIEYGWPDPAWARIAHGWVLLIRGDRQGAAESSRQAAELARAQRDPFGLAESSELAALAETDPDRRRVLLEEALSLWRGAGNDVHIASAELALARLSPGPTPRAERRAERRLAELGVRVSATGPAGILRFAATRRRVPLVVETLGGFRVLREGTPVSPREWQSQKARDLLKILIARHGAPTPREVLMEALWSDGTPSQLANRLSVALSTVHSIVDPTKEYGIGHFVWADKRAIGLDLSHVVVDLEEFLAEAAEGLKLRASGSDAATERLEHAFSLYRGDFLEGDAYEEWAVSPREEARAAFLDVAHALADDAAAGRRHQEVVRYSLRILDRDPYDESAHLRLVSSLAADGRHGEARRRYSLYWRRMEEIGVESASYPGGQPP